MWIELKQRYQAYLCKLVPLEFVVWAQDHLFLLPCKHARLNCIFHVSTLPWLETLVSRIQSKHWNRWSGLLCVCWTVIWLLIRSVARLPFNHHTSHLVFLVRAVAMFESCLAFVSLINYSQNSSCCYFVGLHATDATDFLETLCCKFSSYAARSCSGSRCIVSSTMLDFPFSFSA